MGHGAGSRGATVSISQPMCPLSLAVMGQGEHEAPALPAASSHWWQVPSSGVCVGFQLRGALLSVLWPLRSPQAPHGARH